jgi:hypothetical protein
MPTAINPLAPEFLQEVQDRATARITEIVQYLLDAMIDKRGLVYGDIPLPREERVLKVMDMLQTGELFELASVSPPQMEKVWSEYERDRAALAEEMI